MISLTMNVLLQAAVLSGGGHDYTTAYRNTADSGKPLVVLIGADWCPGCRVMKQSAMPEVEKMGGLKNVSFAYVNADHQSELAGKLMRSGSIPQLIVYHKTENGWKRQQLIGAHSASDIQAFLNSATTPSVPMLSSRQ